VSSSRQVSDGGDPLGHDQAVDQRIQPGEGVAAAAPIGDELELLGIERARTVGGPLALEDAGDLLVQQVVNRLAGGPEAAQLRGKR
jgi:hypothetical protein